MRRTRRFLSMLPALAFACSLAGVAPSHADECTVLDPGLFSLLQDTIGEILPPNKVLTEVNAVLLDTSDAKAACDAYQALLEAGRIEMDASLKAALDQQICHPKEVQLILITLLKEAGQKEEKKNPWKFSAGGGSGFAVGNQLFGQYTLKLGMEKTIDDMNSIAAGADGSYRFEPKAKRPHQQNLVVTAEYKHQLGPHWAIFATSTTKHNNSQEIDLSVDAIGGLMYSILPFSDTDYVRLSVGTGYLYENQTQDREKHLAVAKWRARAKKALSEKMEIAATAWFQHSLYSHDNKGESKTLDFKDYRIEGELALTFKNAIAKGVDLSLTVKDQYINVPAGDAKKNDVTATTVVSGSF